MGFSNPRLNAVDVDIRSIDVFEDGHLSVLTRPPGLLPQQLSLEGLEESFDSRIVVVIPSSAHGRLEPMLAQDLLVVMRAELAAAVGMVNAALGRPAQSNDRF